MRLRKTALVITHLFNVLSAFISMITTLPGPRSGGVIFGGFVVAGILMLVYLLATRRFKPFLNMWGDTVNTTSRMESNGLANVTQVTEAVRDKLKNRFKFEQREPIYVKGKGEMITYLIHDGFSGGIYGSR